MGKLAAAIDILISANSARVKTDTDKISAIIGSASNDWKAKVEAAGKVMGSSFDKAGLSLGGLTTKLGSVGLAMAGLGAGVGVGVIVSKIDDAIEATAKLKDMSEKTGASVENLSALAPIAKVAGTDLDTLAGGMIKLAKNMEASGGPSKEMGAALNRIGLSVKDLKGLDSAEMMKKVADAMSNYGDSAGKTAVATTLFGKSGAELLPVLKDLGEYGELAARTTTEQAYAADAYTDNVKKLTLAKESMYKTLAMEVAPAMAKFTQALLDAKSESDTLQKNLKGLASDGALAAFADGAVRTAAVVIDAFRGIATVVQGTGMAIGATAAAVATGSLTPFKELSADWEKLKAQVNDSSVQKKLDAVYAKGLPGTDGKKPAVGGGNNGSVNSGSSDKQAETFLKGLEQRVTKTNEAEYAALRLKAAELGVGAAAEKWIKQIEGADFTRFVDKWALGLSNSNEKFAFQNELVGKSRLEQEKLTAAYEVNKNLEQTRLDLVQKFGETMANEKWAEITTRANDALVTQIDLIQKRNDKERSASNGMSSAMQRYVDDAGNVGKSVESVFSNGFKSMEDNLVNFAMTGKATFSDFANSVIADIMRIYVRMAITGLIKSVASGAAQQPETTPLPDAKGDAFINGSRVRAYANGGVVSSPTLFSSAQGPSVMGEAGPEAIVPLNRTSDGKLGIRASGMGSNVQVNVVNNAGADGYQATQSQSKDSNGNDIITIIVEKVKQAMNSDVRNNGSFSQLLANKYGLRGTM